MSDLDSGKKIGVWKFFWGEGILPKVRFGPGEEKRSLEIFLGGGVFCQMSDLDSGKKIGVWKFWEGGILSNVRFALREENWSLEIWGGGILPKVRFGLREEKWSLEILEGGILPNFRFGLREEKLKFGNILGGGVFCTTFQNRVFLPIWSKNSGSPACLCITDSLSHTMYVETNQGN